MTDDQGVLSNLPSSRPGQRSEKRAGKTTSPPRQSAARKPRARPRPKAAEPPPPPPRRDPIGAVLGIATGAAGAGVRLTACVARAVLRRLPRL